MNSSESLNANHDDFKKSFRLSVFAHVLVLGLFLIKFIYFQQPLLDLTQAIRVDMVGLPEKMTPADLEKPKAAPPVEKPVEKPAAQPKAPALPEKVKPVEKPEPTVDLKKAKTKQKEAFEKLKKLSAIEKIKQDVKNEAQEQIAQKPVIVKGRVISPGSALTGLDKIDANTYLQGLDQHVKQQWSLPQWLMNKPFKTQVHVKFEASGQIISRTIMKSSGNASYDDYCLQAVDRAAPFPKVPEKFSEKFAVDGVVIGFPE